MADQNFTFSLNVSKNGTTTNTVKSLGVAMAASPVIQNVQVVTTSAELVVTGDVDVNAPGFGYFENLDATNNLLLALDSGFTQQFATLLPGEFAFIPLKTGTVYAKASAASLSFVGIITSR